MKNKKAISSILTTTLIILLAIASISIVSINLNKFLDSNSIKLSPEINCLDLQSSGNIKIISSCLNEDSSEIELTVKRTISDAQIKKLDFVLFSESKSTSWGCGQLECNKCSVLDEGEKRTYFFPTEGIVYTNSLISTGPCQLDKKEISLCKTFK